MARARAEAGGGGISAITVWFIVFVVLWLISTVLFVVTFTDQAALRQEARQAREERDRVISPAQRDTLRDLYEQATPQRPLALLLDEQRRAAVRLAVGEEDLPLPEAERRIRAKLDEIRRGGAVEHPEQFEGVGLLQALDSLYLEYVALKNRVYGPEGLAAQMEALKAEAAEARRQAEQQAQTFATRIEELQQRLASLQRDYEQYRSEKDKQVAALEQALEEARSGSQQQVAELREQLDRAQEQRQRLVRVIEQQREKLAQLMPSADPAVLIKQADGHILGLVGTEGLAYIDLGRRDRITLGMTFAVYPSDGRIPEDGTGKGTIEVIKVFDDTSECRIVQQDYGDPIVVGDLIGNVVYDRTRTFRFAVVGDFDLDYRGKFGPEGAEVIRALIRKWGGQVVDSLDERTDFVVLGVEPPRPTLEDTMTPVERTLAQEQIARNDAYRATVSEARALAIPILTQTQFLNLIGYELPDLMASR